MEFKNFNTVNGVWHTFKEAPQHVRLFDFVYVPVKRVGYLASKIAEYEDWGPNFRFLYKYLDQTFQQVLQEGKVKAFYPINSKDVSFLCWHTGLLTSNYTDIYCLMSKYDKKSKDEPNSEEETYKDSEYGTQLNENEHRKLDWVLDSFQLEDFCTNKLKMGSINLTPVHPLPERAYYFHDGIDRAVYDPKIKVNRESMGFLYMDTRRDGLPTKYRNMSSEELIGRFQFGIMKTLSKIQANPRCAVPQYFRDRTTGRGEIQLLLPINLDFKLDPDCAIAVSLEIFPNSDKYYEIRGFLSLLTAYYNARVIQPVDQDWFKLYQATSYVPQTSPRFIRTYEPKHRDESTASLGIPHNDTDEEDELKKKVEELKLLLELDSNRKPELAKTMIKPRIFAPIVATSLPLNPAAEAYYAVNYYKPTYAITANGTINFEWVDLSAEQLYEVYQYHLGGSPDDMTRLELIDILEHELPNYKRDICKYHATKGCLYKEKPWLCSRNHQIS